MSNNNDMASRISYYRSLTPKFSSALQSFRDSSSKFRVLHSTNPLNQGESHKQAAAVRDASPRTLFILDSSFNPPSIAHKALAMSALKHDVSKTYPGPYRLLLLFATMNADKAPSAASFDQRLTLMSIFASDLQRSLEQKPDEYPKLAVDVGVTTVPYYTDKSVAIATEGAQWYPDQPKHVHLMGFDTFTRFLNPKYYKDFHPPLDALAPYFDSGHQLRVTLRPDDEYGTVDEQRAYLERLESGELESEGGRREWGKQVVLVPPNPRAGVSSTRVRKAAKREDWAEVDELCTPDVAEYLKEEKLYEDDDRGAKMA